MNSDYFKPKDAAWHDEAFANTSDGYFYQERALAMMTFIEPTIEDELIAHSIGVRLRGSK